MDMNAWRIYPPWRIGTALRAANRHCAARSESALRCAQQINGAAGSKSQSRLLLHAARRCMALVVVDVLQRP